MAIIFNKERSLDCALSCCKARKRCRGEHEPPVRRVFLPAKQKVIKTSNNWKVACQKSRKIRIYGKTSA